MSDIVDAAGRLYAHLTKAHWNGEAVVGPDPGIRFNARIYRFPKSYLRAIPWRDDLMYGQAQHYWIEANRLAGDLGIADPSRAADIVVETARHLRRVQQPEGFWEYPNPEWRGRIATVEGNYAAMGLLAGYEISGDLDLLQGAVDWHDYAANHIGYQVRGETYAINYFGNVAGGRIPNNSASAIRTFAWLAQAASDSRFLRYCRPMIEFMTEAQLESGELPYAVAGVTGTDRIHFLCYQYNAFEFMNIADYRDLTGDGSVTPILERLATYLMSGLTAEGMGKYDCHKEGPEVVYYTVAIARALSRAREYGMADPGDLVDRALDRALAHQREDGSFPYSIGNYGFFTDVRSYPRYLSMILTHLSQELAARSAAA